MKNYSQSQEQDAILKYFGDFVGTFADIGSNDGETFSNTRALALLGWKGVLIDPSPTAFPKLQKLYENEKKGNFYLYNCAVAKFNGRITLHDSGSLLKTGDAGLVSTTVAEEKKRFESVLSYKEVEVKCFRWKTLLNRLSIKKFDCISLDAEGADVDILEQIDVTDVKLLIVEWNGHQYLKERFTAKMQGFKIIYTSGENLIFGR